MLSFSLLSHHSQTTDLGIDITTDDNPNSQDNFTVNISGVPVAGGGWKEAFVV